MEQTKGRKMSATFKEEKQREVEENYEFFQSVQSVLPELLKPHFGETFYEDGMFSIQKVDSRPIDLGIDSRF